MDLVSPTLDNTLGAVFLGVVVSCCIFGVTSLQVYIYYHRFPQDSRLHKYSVALLYLLDGLHLALTIFAVYYYGVSNFGKQDALMRILWAVKLEAAVNVVIILVVQSLYAYRVWLLGGYHHGVLGYVVAGVVLAGFGIGIFLTIKIYSLTFFAQLPSISWVICFSYSASTAIDIIISVAMCYYLWRSKSRATSEELGRGLNTRINGLMQYTLSCGVFTSAGSVSCLFTFILMQDNFVYLALSFVLTRLYTNSFISMMNARTQSRSPEIITGAQTSVWGSTTVSHHRLSAIQTQNRASTIAPGKGYGYGGYAYSDSETKLQSPSSTSIYSPTSPQSAISVLKPAYAWDERDAYTPPPQRSPRARVLDLEAQVQALERDPSSAAHLYKSGW